MGTRNLTAVYLDGAYKVAQYGQWDGYPEGQGLTALRFLREKMIPDQFKSALRKCSYISPDELKELWRQAGVEIGAEDGAAWVTIERADAMKRAYPQFSRDTGAEILELIQDHPEGLKLQDDLSFAADSLFCEWAWVVDLDNGTFEGFEGFNKMPLKNKDRFEFLKNSESGDYHGVCLVAKWSLDNLPSDDDFLAAFESEEETVE